MDIIQVFIVGFAFSFLGSIPPGTLNISVLQLALNNHFQAAIRFAGAAAVIELPYALIAVKFEYLITSSPFITNNFNILAAIVLITLGIINLRGISNPSPRRSRFEASGFRKGILLSILNPLSIPFWLGVTAYVRNMGFVMFPSSKYEYSYVFGIGLGTFILLILIAILARRVSKFFQQSPWLKKLPGVVFLILGFYALAHFLMM